MQVGLGLHLEKSDIKPWKLLGLYSQLVTTVVGQLIASLGHYIPINLQDQSCFTHKNIHGQPCSAVAEETGGNNFEIKLAFPIYNQNS